jgi:hypothetical protein
MGVAVSDRDLGWKKLQEIGGQTVQVKVQSVARNTSNKMYAYYVEAGSKYMHGRPFVKRTLEAHGRYLPQMGKIMDRVIAGEDMDKVLDEFGANVKAGVQRTIDEMGLVETHKLHDQVRAAHKIGKGRFKRGTWT